MKKLMTFVLLTSFATGIVAPRIGMSAQLTGTTLDQISGVAFHFTNPDVAAFKQMKSIGLGMARTDLPWQSIETSRGIYNFTTYDALTNAMTTAGIRPMYILDYSNTIYEPVIASGTLIKTTIKPPPTHAQSIAAFSNFAAAAAARYRGKHVIWEIWNEPNIQTFWQTGPNPDQYADLAITTCWAIRNADPDATIIGPALSTISTDFLKAVFARGLLDCLDGVSVHPYRTGSPETVQADYDSLKALIKQYAPPSRAQKIALVNSEWGYSSTLVNVTQQADYVVRQKLIDISNGLRATIWYDWKNDGINPLENEHNYGIIDANGYAKLSYAALLNLNRQLNGMSFIARLATTSANDYAFLFGNNQGIQYVVSWTTDAAHNVKIAPKLAMQAMTTNLTLSTANVQSQLAALNTSLTLTLSSTPVITPLTTSPR